MVLAAGGGSLSNALVSPRQLYPAVPSTTFVVAPPAAVLAPSVAQANPNVPPASAAGVVVAPPQEAFLGATEGDASARAPLAGAVGEAAFDPPSATDR